MFDGKMKALTFSYDDGVLQDRRLIEIFNKYGLKATFNLNSGFFGGKWTLVRDGVTVDHSKPAAAEDSQGKVFNIYAWNEEFKGFFEKYYTVPEGVTVNWIINPSDGGVYQQKLDEALLNQASAADDDKVDMFL